MIRFKSVASGRLAAVTLLTLGLAACAATGDPGPPETRRDAVVDDYHGITIEDPYRWLEDQDSPETRAWIDAENAYTDRVLAGAPERPGLAERLAELLHIDVQSAPIVRNGRYFYSRRAADQDLSVLWMRDGLDGEDRILIDPHPMSEDHTVSVSYLDVSRDGSLVAYAVRAGGVDEISVRFRNVDTGRDLEDFLPTARYHSLDIQPDLQGFYYTRHDENGPRLFHRPFASEENHLLFGEGLGPEKILIATLSEDGRRILASVLHGSAGRQDLFLADVVGQGGFQTVVEGVDALFEGTIAGDRLYIRTDWQAPNGRVFVVDAGAPGRENWSEVIPESENALEGLALAGGRLFAHYLVDVQSRIDVFEADGTAAGSIPLDGPGSVGVFAGRWSSDEAFFSYSSFHLPTTYYRYTVANGQREIWSQTEAPLDPETISVRQVWYTSKDGTRVPMFLVHSAGLEPDAPRPTLLTGYGGFRVSRTPGYSASAVAWVEQGGVYAVANLRGGGEFGESWHRAGMLESKQHTFDDFIAAGEWLVANGWASPSTLAIQGGSNGGLLVGAVMNQRPDLFGAVICTYPLLDMLRYQKFLVAGYWVPEYGSSDDPQQFEWLRAYSPYHNVDPDARYPAVLFISGDGDTRVAPLHARKMAALMQSIHPQRPALLRYHTKAGHSGGQPISEQISNTAESYRFLFWQLASGS